MTKAWGFVLNEHTGEPSGQLVCGECADKHFEFHEVQCVFDHREHFSDNCSICGKNCGDYHNPRKAA